MSVATRLLLRAVAEKPRQTPTPSAIKTERRGLFSIALAGLAL